jgi:hypothetical protein
MSKPAPSPDPQSTNPESTMKTEIAFILDRSGSMSSMTQAAISGFNEFLKAQQATLDDHGQPIPATFTLILFDHECPPLLTGCVTPFVTLSRNSLIIRWRRGWDSNPRNPCGLSGFQDRRNRPLYHPSVRLIV